MNLDGSRRWLRPRVSPGRFLSARRIVGWALVLVFTAVPYIRINGKPMILLDITAREFTFFGTTFLPTDTLLVALLFLSIFLTVFLLTALFGRVWCGWACPQTVYMEFLYRPIERLFEGRNYRTGGKAAISPWRRVAKYAVYLVISMFLAHTFLAYFVGVERLFEWVRGSPFDHPVAFVVMAATTGLMMLDFCYLREQICTLMCPYGRFQSVLLDRQSLIVSYDEQRGEPRGRARRPKKGAAAGDAVTGTTERGDCIDCHLCVVTCPTGIDIRKGLQMECVSCAQCIDACDAVMDKIGRPRGLIRYSSQESMETGRRHFLRPRVIIYPVALAIVLTGLGFALARRAPLDVIFLRTPNATYTVLESGDVRGQALIKITNKSPEPRVYDVVLVDPDATLSPEAPRVEIEPGQSDSVSLVITLPRARFTGGRSPVRVRVTDDTGYAAESEHSMLGPLFGGSGGSTGAGSEAPQ